MPAAGDLAQIVLSYTLGGSICQNSYGIRYDTGTVTASDLLSDLDTYVDANSQDFYDSFMSGKGTYASLFEAKVVDVKPGTAAPTAVVLTRTGGAGSAADPLPQQCSLVTTYRTALAGRAYRGREYESGLLESAQSQGAWVSGALSLNARHQNWLLGRYGPAHTNTNFTWVVLSRYLNGVKRGAPVGTPIVSFTQRGTVYTQRRRVVGFGR
jgi:hypothetical protein